MHNVSGHKSQDTYGAHGAYESHAGKPILEDCKSGFLSLPSGSEAIAVVISASRRSVRLHVIHLFSSCLNLQFY